MSDACDLCGLHRIVDFLESLNTSIDMNDEFKSQFCPDELVVISRLMPKTSVGVRL